MRAQRVEPAVCLPLDYGVQFKRAMVLFRHMRVLDADGNEAHLRPATALRHQDLDQILGPLADPTRPDASESGPTETSPTETSPTDAAAAVPAGTTRGTSPKKRQRDAARGPAPAPKSRRRDFRVFV